jgi:hypothetical protein
MSVKTGIAVMVCVAGSVAFLACSSTTTGTGTNGGKGLDGLLGGGTPGGTTSGGATSSGGGASTLPSSCASASGDSACVTCLKQSCCSPTLACSNNAECKAIVECGATCVDQACYDNCLSSHPNGQANLQSAISCQKTHCQSACGGTTSDAGTAGPACVSSSPSYCSTVPGKPNAKDCPNGPPSAGCELSPSAGSFANVYCCP